jgi:hypothetical protein
VGDGIGAAVNGEWQPANDTERAMMAALVGGDRREYFRILAAADLYLPQHTWDREPDGDGAPEDGDDGGAQRFITAQLFGATFLLVFTSVETMVPQVRGLADAYTITSYAELRDKWPAPEWRLAVNPGSPLDAYVPLDAVEAAAHGDLVIPAAGEVAANAIVEAGARRAAAGAPGLGEGESTDIDGVLLDAAVRGDVNQYVDALLGAVVVMPTAAGVPDPERILEPDFPWLTVGPPHAPTIEVFTSPAMFAEGSPLGGPTVTMPLLLILAGWPDGHALSVNPRTPLAVDLPSDQVQLLLLWAQEDDADADEEQADIGKEGSAS